nr:MAG: ORF1 [TTV-like mini virus]
MPYYRRRRWQRFRRRNWYRNWRPRNTFRRRRRWRRRPRVRRKLQKLTIKEWQPKTIKKCCIKGLHCLFICTEETISRNYRMYEHSFTGEHWPSGGGFSVTKYSLDGLYEQHQLDRNWWTCTNQNLPLVRYLGCKIKLYQSWETDYIVNFNMTYPMVATKLLYLSCQPNFMMMNKHAVIVPSKLTQKLKRGYKTIKLRPPHQMSNRWFFAKDLSKVGLAMITASAASLDHFYIATDKLSNNCSFESLNPYFYKKHDFIQPGVNGYSLQQTGTIEKRLFSTTVKIQPTNIATLKPTTAGLTYLGNSKIDTPGLPVLASNKTNYLDTKTNWGNPFHSDAILVPDHLLVTNENWESLKTLISGDQPLNAKFTIPSDLPTQRIRYAPDRDTGVGNKVYLKSVGRDTTGWEPPHNEELISEGFPIWALLFGFVSWQIKLGEANNIYRAYVLVIESKFFKPELPYYIPIDDDFLEGKSSYIPSDEQIQQIPDDKNNWYPSLKYQLKAIENIVRTGPGIPKLGGRKSVEAKCFYKFYFKFGGNPPKMDSVNNPAEQETYPVPNYQPQTYSLQDPTMPQEYYLYQFDEHQGIITKQAAKRIAMHKETQKALFSTTGKMDAATYQAQTDSDSSEEQEDTETLKLKLRKLKRQRQHLEQQIQYMMDHA